MAFFWGLDKAQCVQVESWFAKEMVQVLRIAHAAVLSGCQSWSSDGISLHLTRGQVLAKRRDLSSGRFSPVNSGERRWAGRRKESPSTQQCLNPRQCLSTIHDMESHATPAQFGVSIVSLRQRNYSVRHVS